MRVAASVARRRDTWASPDGADRRRPRQCERLRIDAEIEARRFDVDEPTCLPVRAWTILYGRLPLPFLTTYGISAPPVEVGEDDEDRDDDEGDVGDRDGETSQSHASPLVDSRAHEGYSAARSPARMRPDRLLGLSANLVRRDEVCTTR